MAFVTEVLLGIVGVLTSYLAYKWYKNPLRKIPGPPGLPLLGNILTLDVDRMHMQFYDYYKKYGPVFIVHIFSRPVVVVNTGDGIIEALVKKGTDFQARPPLPRMTEIVQRDIAFSSFDHPKYMTLRKVATRALRSYGAGIPKLEHIIQDTMQDIVDNITSQEDKLLDTYQISYGFVVCVMASILFGEKYSYDDPICTAIHDMNAMIVQCADPKAAGAFYDLFPGLFNWKFLSPKCHEHIAKTKALCDEVLHERIRYFKKTFDPNNMRGCFDFFLRVQDDEKDVNGNPVIDDQCLTGLMVDLIVGGVETSLASLSEAFLKLLRDQKLQKRLQTEIDEVIGPSRPITYNDKEKLPQLEAFCHENLRYLSQVPMMLPHYTAVDTDVGGYQVPKGTRVFFNSFCAAHDPKVYDKPFEFDLDRYLDANGKIVPPDHPARRNFLGFGAGRRQCPGELLARTRIYLLLARLLQKFHIVPEGDIPDYGVEKYLMGVIINPPPVKAKFIPRSC